MAALNSTVPSVPAREYVFVLTHEDVRAGKRGEGSGEAGCKVLGAYGREVLNEKYQPLLGFAEDNKLALLTPFFATPNVACLTRFEAPTTARDKTVWTISLQSGWTSD